MIKAPYNFVPLSDKIVFPKWADEISIDRPFVDGISGTIEVQYTSKTPVFIGKGKDSQENYRAANGKFAIPGSSLRGMLRNVIEIASFGKFNRVSDAALSVRDLSNRMLYSDNFTKGNNPYTAVSKAGWLNYEKEKGWVLYPVKYYRVEDSLLESKYGLEKDKLSLQGKYKYFRDRPEQEQNEIKKHKNNMKDVEKRISLLNRRIKVQFDSELVSEESHKHHQIGNSFLYLNYSKIENFTFDNDNYSGYVVLTGHPGSNKHMDFLFEKLKKGGQTEIKLDEKLICEFKQANAPSAADQKRGLDLTRKLKTYNELGYPAIPVFYLTDSNGNIKSLGLSQMYRLPYKNSLHEAIKHSGNEHFSDKMDFAECVFGRISNDSKHPEKSLRGRVQFEDAVSNISEKEKLELFSMILNTPKPTYYPNYIEQNSNKYKTLMDSDVHLRGWKRYPVKQLNIPTNINQNTAILSSFKPLPAAKKFTGKIHFHNLKKEELGALLWAITWGMDPNLSHSVGMGKPYGFGQIKANILSLFYLCNSSATNEYEDGKALITSWISDFSTFMNKEVNGWESSLQLNELKAMANPDKANRNNWDLSYMSLGSNKKNELNEFIEAKKDKSYLAPYSASNQEEFLSGAVKNKSGKQPGNKKQNTNNYPVQNKIIHTCELKEKKEKTGVWMVVSKDNPNMKGSILNYNDVPANKK
nr:TIGR03986 family CRISPR-associated RAMP protein [Treponema sp.]